MPLAGRQLTYGWALATCYYVGWRGKDLRDAVALMCAESARYEKAYHENFEGSAQMSTDRGLFQINDKWHQDISDEDAYNGLKNAAYAFGMWRASKGFSPWMAYESGAYQKFLPTVFAAWLLPRWRLKVAKVEKYYD